MKKIIIILLLWCPVVFGQVVGRRVPIADSALTIDTTDTGFQTYISNNGGGSGFIWEDSAGHGPDSVIYADTALLIRDIGQILNVDTANADKHDVLVWNGSGFIMAPYDTTLTFSINTASASAGSATQLIGADASVWKAAGAISFAATYFNGPPDSAHVRSVSTPSGMEAVDSTDADCDITDGSAVSDKDITYPTSKDVTVYWGVSAYFLPDYEGQTATGSVTFRNYIYYGTSATGSSFNEAAVEAISNSTLTNDNTQTWGTFNPGVGEYLAVAYPANYTALNGGDDYEDDGTSNFLHFGITCAMLDAYETVSITNSAGFTENYEVFASTVTDLPSGSFVTTSATALNQIFWGVTTKTSGFDDADIHGLSDSSKTNQDESASWNATASTGQYLCWAVPKRLCTGGHTFYVGGFEGGWEAPETVSHTNFNGWTEDYYVYRSTNANLGNTTWETVCE